MIAVRAIAASLVLVGAVLAGCGGDQAMAPDPACVEREGNCVVIGVGEAIPIGTLLFERDASGRDTRNSVELALDYLDGDFDGRDGRVLGHGIDVINDLEDCTPDGGREGARRLLADAPDLVAVIGTTCSAAAFRAAATVLSQRRVLMVSPTNTSPLMAEPAGREPYYFRTAFNDLIQAAVVAEFARVALRARRAAVVTRSDAYSSVLATAFADAFRDLGGAVAPEQVITDGSSFAGAARRMATARPEVIFIPLFDPPCGQVLAAIRRQPALRETPVIVSESCLVRSFTRGMDDRNVYGTAPASVRRGPNDFYSTEFLPAYRRRFNTAPAGVFTAQAVDAINLVINAIRRVAVPLPGGGLRINRAELRAAMLDVVGYEGVSGTLSCEATGDCVQSARIAVYRAPGLPGGGRRPAPVFSATRSLAEVSDAARG